MRPRGRSAQARPPHRTAAPNDPESLQQHDLAPAAAAAVVANCGLEAGERVLEVGPGTGALTGCLLARGAQVQAIEIDPARVAALAQAFAAAIASDRLALVKGDAATMPMRFSGPWRVIANPPFQLTAALLRRWLLDPPGEPPTRIDLVLQLQAARKLCGEPQAETRSSVLLRLAGAPRIVRRLARTDVTPPSRVDLCHFASTRTRDACDTVELARVDRLLEIAFAGPHTVTQALRGRATAIQLRRQAAEHGWRPEAHPRTLSAPAWRSLAAILARCGQL